MYLRPETAQGIFIGFKNVLNFARKKPPFGIAVGRQVPSATRSPPATVFRTREFEQMEMEFFVPPADTPGVVGEVGRDPSQLVPGLGIPPRLPDDPPAWADELSHYSSGTSDVQYLFPIGWSGLEGIANRQLRPDPSIQNFGRELRYFDQRSGERYIPREPAAGADRAALAFLVDSLQGRRAASAPCFSSTPRLARSRNG